MDVFLVLKDFTTKRRRLKAGDRIHVDDIDSPATEHSLMDGGYIEPLHEPAEFPAHEPLHVENVIVHETDHDEHGDHHTP